MDKRTRLGRSRRGARRNIALRKELSSLWNRLLEEQCLLQGFYGELTLRVPIENGILQQEYEVRIRRTYR